MLADGVSPTAATSELELRGSRSVLGKTKNGETEKKTGNINPVRKRPEFTDDLPTSHNSDRKPRKAKHRPLWNVVFERSATKR